MATYPSDPFLIYKRLGTKDSPYIQYTSPIRVTNGKVYLKEIPNQSNHVTVTDGTTYYSEVYSQASLSTSDNYYVDYDNGIVYFDPSHNDKLLTFSYLGEGIVSIPANRVYTQSANGSPTQDLQDMIDNYNQLNGTDLYNLFDPQTGHKHTGASGDAPPIDSQYVNYSGNGVVSTSNVKDTLDSHAASLADIALDVKVQYGLKGDGTTDDSTAIQNAINALPASGGKLLFPDSPILINSNINFNGKNIDLITGPNTTFTGTGTMPTNITNANHQIRRHYEVTTPSGGATQKGDATISSEIYPNSNYIGNAVAGYFGAKTGTMAGSAWAVNAIAKVDSGFTGYVNTI